MVVKVYGPIRAACPQRVIVCLLEMGVDFELVPVDLESGEHKKPDFLLRQPFGQVPAIEDGDFRLFGIGDITTQCSELGQHIMHKHAVGAMLFEGSETSESETS